MYGMVNAAIEQMVSERFGAARWQSVKARAGIDDPMFLSMKQYPDAVTESLAVAVAEELSMSLPEVLHAFGVFWVEYARRGPYGRLMLASGTCTYELLAALDAMHARIGLGFPELRPPSFRVEPHDGEVLVEYRSERRGLAPFVVGLLEGVGNLFDERVEVTQVASKDAGAPHDRFLVRASRRTGP